MGHTWAIWVMCGSTVGLIHPLVIWVRYRSTMIMWVMHGLYGSTIGHVWVIRKSHMGHMGHNGSNLSCIWVMYGSCMSHVIRVWVIWVMNGSTVGHMAHIRVSHGSYGSGIAQHQLYHGSCMGYMGQPLVMYRSYMGHLWVIHGSCMGHIGNT